MRLTIPRQPQPHALPRNLTIPQPILPATPIQLPRRILTPTARALRKNNILITHLRRKPALDKRRRILGQILVELALRIRLVDFLDEEGELVVGADDGLQVGDVGAVAVVFLELRDYGVGEGDADVVDGGRGGWGGGFGVCGRRAVDVGSVDADGVGELDGREGLQVLEECVWDVGEVDLLAAEELRKRVSWIELSRDARGFRAYLL
jgi:hypothetical protein